MEKEKFIGELRKHLSEAGEATKQKHHFRHTRTLGKISPVGVALLVGAITVLGMLSMFLTTQFFIQMQTDTQLNGAMEPLFLFDGNPFSGQFYNLSSDVDTMNAGDVIDIPHSLINSDNYAWLVEPDLHNLTAFYSTPMHQWYGYNLTFHYAGNLTEITWPVMFTPGDNLDMIWRYSLHHEFVTAPDPLQVQINFWINRTNAPPIGTDDTIHLNYGEIKNVNITGNDIDFENDHLSIVFQN